MQDRKPDRRNFLRRTAGPYIGVNLRSGTDARQRRLWPQDRRSVQSILVPGRVYDPSVLVSPHCRGAEHLFDDLHKTGLPGRCLTHCRSREGFCLADPPIGAWQSQALSTASTQSYLRRALAQPDLDFTIQCAAPLGVVACDRCQRAIRLFLNRKVWATTVVLLERGPNGANTQRRELDIGCQRAH